MSYTCDDVDEDFVRDLIQLEAEISTVRETAWKVINPLDEKIRKLEERLNPAIQTIDVARQSLESGMGTSELGDALDARDSAEKESVG